MLKMGIPRIFKILFLVALFSGCGVMSKMSKKYDSVGINVQPKVLQVHGGNVDVNLDFIFPEKYFGKKALMEITPVLVYDNGETALKSIKVQGEEAVGGEATIFSVKGGSVKYEDVIAYNEDMLNSVLELRTNTKINDKIKNFPTRPITNGVIATSKRVLDNEDVANNNHGYEYETILEESATIYFLVNQSNIRTTEKSDQDIKKLKDFADRGYKTHSIEIKSFASPEGNVSTNDNVSNQRMRSTVRYTKQILRSLKVDGAKDESLYTETSMGEDWDGFRDLISSSKIKDKRRINNIVNSTFDVNKREQQIRDLAEIYVAIENNVLPQLRKATVVIRSYEPKRTDQEIKEMVLSNPAELTVNEMLFSATMYSDNKVKEEIYNKVVELHNDWRAYNNIACIYLSQGKIDQAESYLSKAESLTSKKQDDILINQGIIAARRGELQNAQNLFSQSRVGEKNQAILDLRKGDYDRAARFYKNGKSYNATLSQLMNGKTTARCNESTANCYYLNAIGAARSGDISEVMTNLNKAISKDSNFKDQAAQDLEFIDLRKNEDFIAIINK